ncbi:major allergen Pru ar 1-like [Populus alba x Populus x berolinensis]|nr:major allergen Pru ar 1-like [Populus alba x Populus x berolinensis]
MGLITFENEFSVAVPPAKLFKVYCLETDTLIPKILPQSIKSSEIIEGNGGPGTIRKVTFKIETIDEENFAYSFSLIESNVWMEGVEKVIFEHTFVPTPEGGSICKRTSNYYIKDGAEIKEDQIKKDGKKTEGLFKAVEAYFLANPDA